MYDVSRNTTEAMLTRMTWRSRIAQTLEQNGLTLHFQGIVHTRDGNLSHLEALVRMLDPLQPGYLICLDDFGSGFSIFAYLKYLGAQILTIDGMFIRDLPNNRDNQAFVKAMIDVAHGLGKVTVAEFVEDADTLIMPRDFGVDMAQGYHLDRPSAHHPSFDRARTTHCACPARIHGSAKSR